MRTVISLSDTALLARDERADAAAHRRHVRAAARALAPLTVDDQLLLCHGNGRQVSQLALESENDNTLTRPYPLDLLGAQTQGMIGYLLVQELRLAGVRHQMAAVVTQAVVERDDPGFHSPSAFVGPGYTREQIQLWAGELGWRIAHDGHEWRRVVPALNPVHVLEVPVIRALVDAGALVVCGGGGGVPVCADGAGFGGVDALVDSDLTAALLAVELDADRLVLLTDMTELLANLDTEDETAPRHVSLADLDAMNLDASTMNTKLEAARRFVVATGRPALLGPLDSAAEVLAGHAGTAVTAY